MKDAQEILQEEASLIRLDEAIIAIMDLIRDETGLDSDSDLDDVMWGYVREGVYSTFTHSYETTKEMMK